LKKEEKKNEKNMRENEKRREVRKKDKKESIHNYIKKRSVQHRQSKSIVFCGYVNYLFFIPWA